MKNTDHKRVAFIWQWHSGTETNNETCNEVQYILFWGTSALLLYFLEGMHFLCYCLNSNEVGKK